MRGLCQEDGLMRRLVLTALSAAVTAIIAEVFQRAAEAPDWEEERRPRRRKKRSKR